MSDAHAPPRRAKVVAAFVALYVLWGGSYLFTKWAVAGIPPFVAAALRQGVAGTLLYAWTRATGAPRPPPRDWRVATMLGALLLVGGNGMLTWAAPRVPSGLSALMIASVPIWIVALEWARPGGIRPTSRTALGLAFGTLGLAALVVSAGGIGARTGGRTAVLFACGGLVISSFAWASGSILSRHVVRHPHRLLATSMEMLAAAALLVPIAWLTGDLARFQPLDVTAMQWISLGYLIVFGSLIGFSAYTWLLQVSTTSRVATYAYVNPIVAVALGWAFAGERLTAPMLGAAALILAAVVTLTLPSWETPA